MKKRLFSILTALALCLTLLPTAALAAEGVPYKVWNGSAIVDADAPCTYYTEVTSSTTTWDAGWYVVKGPVTISGTVTFSGDVHLILCDGAELTVQGITSDYSAANTLTIYGQRGGTGKLTIDPLSGTARGIYTGGSMTVNGGEVTVNQTSETAHGICVGGSMTVNGGEITVSVPTDPSSTLSNGYAGGIFVNGELTIARGAIVSAASIAGTTNAKDHAFFFGVYASDSVKVNGTLIATVGAITAKNYSTYTYGVQTYGSMTVGEGGILTAAAGTTTGEGSTMAYSYGVSAGSVTVKDGGTLNADAGTTTGTDQKATSYGVYALTGSVTIERNGTLNADAGTAVSTNNEAKSYGVYVRDGSVTVGEGAALNVNQNSAAAHPNDTEGNYTSGNASGTSAESCGVYASASLTVNESAEVTVYSGAVNSTSGVADSYGVSAFAMEVNENAEVTATAGTATNEINNTESSAYSYGVYVADNVNVRGMLTVNGSMSKSQYGYARSYGVYATDLVTIEGDGTLNANGGAAESKAGDAYSYGVSTSNGISVNGTLNADAGTTKAPNDNASSYGVYAGGSGMIVNGILNANRNAAAAHPDDTTGNYASGNASGTSAESYGVYANTGLTVNKNANVTAYGGAVEEQDGSADSAILSVGVSVSGTATLMGKLTAVAGTATVTDGEARSVGLDVRDNNIVTGAEVTVTGGAAESGGTGSAQSYGMSVSGEMDASGGTIDGDVYLRSGTITRTAKDDKDADTYTTFNGTVTGNEGATIEDEAKLTVTFTENGNTLESLTQKVLKGQKAEEPEYKPTVPEGMVGGWYEEGRSIAFDFSEDKINTHLELMARCLLPVSGVALSMGGYRYGGKVTDFSLAEAASNEGVSYNGYAATSHYGTYYGISTRADSLDSIFESMVGKDWRSDDVFEADTDYYLGVALFADKDHTLSNLTKADITLDGVAADNWIYVEGGTPDTYIAVFKLPRLYAPADDDSEPTYSVNLPGKTVNGELTIRPRSAEAGDTVTITVTPDKGYTLETLTVTDKNGREIQLTNKGDGKFTFKMPAGRVDIKATFMEDNSMLNFFTDVPAEAYYYDAVLWAAEKGITGGIDENHFGPNRPCTRAQTVTFLYRAAQAMGLDVSVGEDTNILSYGDAFDIPEYAIPAFQWAVGAGILQGDGGNLSPNGGCTRAQIVTFLFRFAAANGVDFVTMQELVSGYGDANGVPGYALPAFNWALAGGIVQGNNGNLNPTSPCTRAQIVTFLYRMSR